MDSNWQRQVDCMSANTICGQCSLWICAVWPESYTVRIIGIIKIIYLFYKTETRQILHMYICFLYAIAICDIDVESEFYNLFNLLQPIYALHVVIVPSKVMYTLKQLSILPLPTKGITNSMKPKQPLKPFFYAFCCLPLRPGFDPRCWHVLWYCGCQVKPLGFLRVTRFLESESHI